MNKREFVKFCYSKERPKCLKTRKDIGEALNFFIENINDVVINQEEKLIFRRWGSFELGYRKSYKHIHPKNLKEMIIPERKTMKFKTTKIMRENLNK